MNLTVDSKYALKFSSAFSICSESVYLGHYGLSKSYLINVQLCAHTRLFIQCVQTKHYKWISKYKPALDGIAVIQNMCLLKLSRLCDHKIEVQLYNRIALFTI